MSAATSIPTMPRGTDPPAAPVGQDPKAAARQLAPWPSVDRYPTIIGQNINLGGLAAASRTALIGYRQQYVDILCELLEKDCHLFSVLQKRILTIAGAKLEVTPVELPADADDAEKEAAQAVADFVSQKILAIPDLGQHIANLAWAIYYGLTAAEIHWDKVDGEWLPVALSKIHTRRLAYPDQGAWDLYVWDQGNVMSPWGLGRTTTSQFGLRVADFPGKFVVHTPELRADYPTRDGLGRVVDKWVCLKLIASRNAGQYLERFAKPWVEGIYSTDENGEGHPRAATDPDIADAKDALTKLGAGSLSSWTHPDSIKLEVKTPDGSGSSIGKLGFKDWIELCNGELSKAVLGGTLTTEVGVTGGNRALGTVHESSEMRIDQYDADCIAATVRRDIGAPIVRLNFPPAWAKYTPSVRLHVGAEPDPDSIIARAAAAAKAGMPVDADAVAEEAGVPLVAPGNDKGRRMAPINMVDLADLDPDFAAAAIELAKKRMEAMPPPPAPAPGPPGKPGQPGAPHPPPPHGAASPPNTEA